MTGCSPVKRPAQRGRAGGNAERPCGAPGWEKTSNGGHAGGARGHALRRALHGDAPDGEHGNCPCGFHDRT